MGKKRSRREPEGSPTGSAGAGGRGWRLAAWLIPALLALLVYANTLGHGYTLDDVEIVQRNPLVTGGAGAAEILGTPYWGEDPIRDRSLYRPLTIATYVAGHAIHGGSPGPAHAVNVLFHALATLALVALLRDLFRDDRLALVAGALFAVHPIHTEAVAGIVGRAEVLALLGMLVATIAWFRAVAARGRRSVLWGAASVAAFAAGALSKESGLAAPALVAVTEIVLPARRRVLRGDRRALGLAAAWAAAALGVLVLRAGVVTGRSVNEGFRDASALERALTAIRLGADSFGQLLAPVRLSADAWVTNVPLARSPLEPGVLVGFALGVALAALAIRVRRTRPAATWGLAGLAVLWLPTSNLLFPIGVLKAERLLYAPSLGFATAAAALLVPGLSSARRRTATAVALAAIVVALSALTWRRNPVWRDNCTLAAASLETSPDSPIFLTMRARCLLDAGRPEEATELLDRALAIRPDFPTAHLVYGLLLRDAQDWPAALDRFERILAREPTHRVALDNASWVAYRMGRYDRAAEWYDRWRDVAPENPGPWAGGIAALGQLRRLDEAERLATEAVRRFPDDPDVRKNERILREILREAGP